MIGAVCARFMVREASWTAAILTETEAATELLPAASRATAVKVCAPAAAPAEGTPGELADRYGSLLEKLDGLNAEAEELKARIIALADGAGLLAGQKYELEIMRADKPGFKDRAAVIAVLNEFGLYQKALDLTLPKIAALMNDPSVPAAAREKLAAQASKSRVCELKVRKIK